MASKSGIGLNRRAFGVGGDGVQYRRQDAAILQAKRHVLHSISRRLNALLQQVNHLRSNQLEGFVITSFEAFFEGRKLLPHRIFPSIRFVGQSVD